MRLAIGAGEGKFRYGLRPRRADERAKGRRWCGGLALRGCGVEGAYPGATSRDHERGNKTGAGRNHSEPDVKHQVRNGHAASGNGLPGLGHPLHGGEAAIAAGARQTKLAPRDRAASGMRLYGRGLFAAAIRVVRKLLEHLVAPGWFKVLKRPLHDKIYGKGYMPRKDQRDRAVA